jgi:CheY-like chemotaxis protein
MNRKKILVVDDNPVITKTLSMKLTSAGYEVITAAEGSDAVAAARKQKPDLIVLDISLPENVGGVPWDGFKIIEWLRRLDEAKNIPVIVITGAQAEQFKDKSLSTGAVAFFRKPIDNEQLLEAIRKALEGADKPVAP